MLWIGMSGQFFYFAAKSMEGAEEAESGERRCLVLPWGAYPAERLNVRNGLCLSRLHDAAFDRGLIAFDEQMRLVLSSRLKEELPQRAVAESFAAYEGESLSLPADAALPQMEFLAAHYARWIQGKVAAVGRA